MLLTDEGSIPDDLSNLSDDAHGYEAEEDDDHAVRACLHFGANPHFVPKEGIFLSFISCIFLARPGDISGNFFWL